MGETQEPARAENRWGHLVNAAFHVESTASTQGGIDATLALVDSALEVFGPEIDPVDDFEGYAVRRFLLAIQAALTTTGAARSY